MEEPHKYISPKYLSPGEALAQLARHLDDSSGINLEPLAHLAPASLWDQYWQLNLLTLIRSGPTSEGLAPARLLSGAELAATIGVVSMDTPARLRQQMESWAAALRAQGAWHAETPMWWEPLPKPGQNEQRWRHLGEMICFPSRPVFAALRKAAPFPGAVLKQILQPTLLEGLSAELELGWQTGSLGLVREGVGADGKVSESRTDAVRYLDGTEAEVLAAAPQLAGLVQWLRMYLPQHMEACFEGKQLHTPLRAMLARYEGPVDGYRKHLDNPGGSFDNGRTVTFTLYLQSADNPCNGGGIAIWPPQEAHEPLLCVAPAGATALAFDARQVPHQVLPLFAGPPRWALILWLSDAPQSAPPMALPKLKPLSLLLALPQAPLPPHKLAFHRLSDGLVSGEITLHTPKSSPRIGAVATVYRAQALLPKWCDHHLTAGLDHLLLIFDHWAEPEERALAEQLKHRFGHRLTVWSGTHTAETRWPQLPQDERLKRVLTIAKQGSSSQAVSARQMLNASAALLDAKAGGQLDWLIHLDADEQLVTEGPARGGGQLKDCFAAADDAGFHLLRFTNHELLWEDGGTKFFKLNPRLAAARLGERGWAQVTELLKLNQPGQRPWFLGYHNGKSAVSVTHGLMAAGVHSWYLTEATTAKNAAFVAGPHVLHHHVCDGMSFARKYLAKADAPLQGGTPLFRVSPVEEAAMALIEECGTMGCSREETGLRLELLFNRLTCFTERERDLLREAGLVWQQ